MRIRSRHVYDLLIHLALRHPRGVLVATALGVAFSLLVTAMQLTFHTHRLDLISSGDRYKQLDQAYDREFEELPDRVIVAIRSTNPLQAKAFATALGRRWEVNPHIDSVLYRIDVHSLTDKGLFYLSPDELIALRQTLQRHQPLLEELTAVPTLENLFRLINRELTEALVGHVFTGFLEEKKKPPDLGLLLALMEEMNKWVNGRPAYRSPWGGVLTRDAESLSQDGFLWSDDRQLLFVLAHPRATSGDFNRFQEAVRQVRADVRQLQQGYPDIEVGVTGRAVLESDEMTAAQRDMTIATVIALAMVALLFVIFFRGVVNPALVVLTLMAGLCWSLGFTALTVGHLNIFTIIFAPMLIGLGIDYGIHFTTRYEDERAGGQSIHEALERTMTGTGTGIVTATLTTATAFMALLLSGFKGLSELGFITGSGLVLMLLATFTCLPALLVLCERRGAGRVTVRQPLPNGGDGGYLPLLYRRPGVILVASALLVGLSLLGVRRVGTDFNFLHLQAEGTESVVWVQKIFESAQRSVLFGEISAESLEEVKHKAAALRALPSVAGVESIAAVIPEDQEQKLPFIRELRTVLPDILLPPHIVAGVDLDALRDILGRIKFKLMEVDDGTSDAAEGALSAHVHEVRRLIDRFVATTTQIEGAEALRALTAFQEELGRDLREKLTILKANVEAQPLTIADLPPELHSRYVGRTGKYRLFVFPAEDVWALEPLGRFVADLKSVDPDALGVPVLNYVYLKSLKEGYKRAALYAFLGIVFLAFLAFRSLRFTLLALVPLIMGALWTLGLMALLAVPFNVANLLFLPLVMGVGIDNGVYIVHAFREAKSKAKRLIPLARSTGKAITLSSLTTMVGFGSLMISSHRGIHSLGLLLAMGVGSVLVAALVVLPSVLSLLAARSVQKPDTPAGGGDADEHPDEADITLLLERELQADDRRSLSARHELAGAVTAYTTTGTHEDEVCGGES